MSNGLGKPRENLDIVEQDGWAGGQMEKRRKCQDIPYTTIALRPTVGSSVGGGIRHYVD